MNKLISVLAILGITITAIGQPPSPPFPVKRTESPETWRRDGWNAVDQAKKLKFRTGKARNVILFVGDGMGISTLTAARILEGQRRGESGEENRLSFEGFPFVALSKTYGTNQQTSDSAPTMSAIITGVKTGEGIISLNQNVVRGDHTAAKGNETKTLLEMAEEAGKSTGIVTTAAITHATPAACYSHSPDRNWESDSDIAKRRPAAYEAKFPDIARQLIEFRFGNGLEVALGGGRSKFLPSESADPEYSERKGERLDKRNLINEWTKKRPDSAYVWNKAQFNAIDTRRVGHLLGLFEPSHMQYEHDRLLSREGEPSLAEMTAKAIDILSKNDEGYFLMVEAGRIDHAHHNGNAFRALTDTIALSDAVRAAVGRIDLNETLVVVTADHSHTFTIAGYPIRGNNIMGLVREVNEDGKAEDNYALARDKQPFTTLGYANGTNGTRTTARKPLTAEQVQDPDFKQESLVPLIAETHGGEDVAIFATGVNAHYFRGSMEQNWIFYVMADAFGFKR